MNTPPVQLDLVNIDDAPDLTASLLEDSDISEAEAESFLKDLLGVPVPTPPTELTPEQVEAQAVKMEAARNYDVPSEATKLLTSITDLKSELNKLLVATTAHLNAEYNKAVLNEDTEGQNFLVSTEAPRWYQLSVQDFQVAFMKLERAITHPEGL